MTLILNENATKRKKLQKIAKKYAVLQSSIHLLRPKDKRSQKK